jgi:hypothetical protein
MTGFLGSLLSTETIRNVVAARPGAPPFLLCNGAPCERKMGELPQHCGCGDGVLQ